MLTIYKSALLTIYKSFLRPHLDYRDVIYDCAFNKSSQNKLESVQYNAALAVTVSVRGSSRGKLYQELGLGVTKVTAMVLEIVLVFQT